MLQIFLFPVIQPQVLIFSDKLLRQCVAMCSFYFLLDRPVPHSLCDIDQNYFIYISYLISSTTIGFLQGISKEASSQAALVGDMLTAAHLKHSQYEYSLSTFLSEANIRLYFIFINCRQLTYSVTGSGARVTHNFVDAFLIFFKLVCS